MTERQDDSSGDSETRESRHRLLPRALTQVRSARGRSYLNSIFFAGLSGVASVAITILAARLLGATQYGWVVLGLSVGNLLVPLVNLGSDRVLVRDLAFLSTAHERMELLSDNVTVRLLVLLPLLFLLTATAFVHGGITTQTVTFVSISAWAMLQGLYPYSLFDYLGRTALQNALVVVERLSALVLVVVLFGLPGRLRTASLFGAVVLFCRAVSVVWQYRHWDRIARKLGLAIRLKFVGLRSGGTSVVITVVQLSSACVVYLNPIFLGASQQRRDLAAYGLVFQIAAFVLVLQSQVLRLLLTGIASACSERLHLRQSLVKDILLMTAVSGAFATGTWVISYALSRYLPGEGFHRMPVLATPLALWTVVAGVGLVATQYLINLKREASYFVINSTGAVCMVALGYLLVPRYGALAAAILLLFVHTAMITAHTVVVASAINDNETRENRERPARSAASHHT